MWLVNLKRNLTQIHPDETEPIEYFLQEAANKVNFLIYLHRIIYYNRNINSYEGAIDIDFIKQKGNQYNISKSKRNFNSKS